MAPRSVEVPDGYKETVSRQIEVRSSLVNGFFDELGGEAEETSETTE